jgi:Bacterial nucleoid DNA-binding protein
MASVEEALVAGEKVQLVGFGTFETRERAAREGRNPRDPEKKIKIPASKAPVFKAGKGLKEKLTLQKLQNHLKEIKTIKGLQGFCHVVFSNKENYHEIR